MTRWIRDGAIVGAVAIVLGVGGPIFASSLLCFDTCPHDLSGAIVSQLARWLSIGLVVTGCAWILSVLTSARGGQWRWFAVLLLSLPVTVFITEAALWIADGGIAGGWLVPQYEYDLSKWKSWLLVLLLVWPVIVFLGARGLGRVGAYAAGDSSSAVRARQPSIRGRLVLSGLGALLVTVVVGGLIANQGAETHFSTLRGWLASKGSSAYAVVNDHGTTQRPMLLVPGYVLGGVNSSQTIEVYEYPLAALAAHDAAGLRPSDFGSASVPTHIFYRGRLIVVYQGDDGGTLFLLTGLLGPQLVGASTPLSS